jgi:hypothetical protein
MAYMLSILACIGFAAMGYMLMTIRVKNATLCPLPMFIVCGRLAISALSIMSEAFMLAIMFSEGTTLFFRLGCIIVVGRVGNVVPTTAVLYSLFGAKKSERAAKYKRCFDRNHFLDKVYPYVMLSFLSLWDCSLVALLPWRYSEFADKSRGFPDMLTLRTTSYYKIAQDITRFVCNVFYLLNAVDEAADASVEVMTYFNMAASVATIVLAGMVAVMKNSVLMEVEAHKGTAADAQSDERQSSYGRGASAIEMMDAEGGGAAWASNPMHDESADPSTIFVRNPPETSVRTLIVQLLPDIDGPSLHAVDSAFKKGGVETMAELKTYLEGGVISIGDIKHYASEGGLLMGDVMTLVAALKPFMSRWLSEGGGGMGWSNGGNGGGNNSATVLSALHDTLHDTRNELLDELRSIKGDVAAAARSPVATPTAAAATPPARSVAARSVVATPAAASGPREEEAQSL